MATTTTHAKSKHSGLSFNAHYAKELHEKILADPTILSDLDYNDCSTDEFIRNLHIFFANNNVDSTNIFGYINDENVGLKAKLMANTQWLVKTSIPYEQLTDADIVELSCGDKTLVLQGLTSDLYYRTIYDETTCKDKTYRIFVLDHDRMHKLAGLSKKERQSVNDCIKDNIHSKDETIIEEDALRPLKLTYLFGEDGEPEPTPVSKIIQTPRKHRNEAFDNLLEAIKDVDKSNLIKLHEEIDGYSSFHLMQRFPCGTPDFAKILKSSDDTQSLHHSSVVAEVISVQSLAHMTLKPDPRAKQYLRNQSSLVQSIIESYKIELYYFGKILETLKNHFNIKMETSLVEHSSRHLPFEKFNGIDISTISIFQQFLKQLDRVSPSEIRRKYVNELMDLRIDPDSDLDAEAFMDGATTLSTKVTRMYKLVKDNPTLSPTEARLLIRSMTSRILDLESSPEMSKFKEDVLKINEDAYNAALAANPDSSETQFGMVSMVISLMKKIATKHLEQEAVCQHYNDDERKKSSKKYVSFFTNASSPTISNVITGKPAKFCGWALAHREGFLPVPCKFEKTTCKYKHNLDALDSSSKTEKESYTCNECNTFGCPRSMSRKFSCQKKNSKKTVGQDGKRKPKDPRDDDKEKRKREEASIKKLRRELNQVRRERNEAHDSINEFVKRQKSVHFASNSASTEESGESSGSESEDGGSAGKPKETIISFIKPAVLQAAKARHQRKQQAKGKGKGKGNGNGNPNKRNNRGNGKHPKKSRAEKKD